MLFYHYIFITTNFIEQSLNVRQKSILVILTYVMTKDINTGNYVTSLKMENVQIVNITKF